VILYLVHGHPLPVDAPDVYIVRSDYAEQNTGTEKNEKASPFSNALTYRELCYLCMG
jgi:hypothetical protein